jgi:hypothetical protein
MKIGLKAFCCGCLVLPIVVPALLAPFEASGIFAILLLSLWFAGIPYLLFAILGCVWIARAQGHERLIATMWAAPLMFLPFAVLGWLLHQLIGRISNPKLVIIAADFFPVAIFTLFIGYAYVLLAQFTLFILHKLGIVE